MTLHWIAFLMLAVLAHSLVGLAAIWAGLGRRHWFIRLAVLGGVLGLGVPMGAYDLMLIFLTQSVVALVPLWIIGRGATGALDSGGQGPEGEALRRKRRPQFGLLDLLLATVVVAALVAFVVRVPGDVWDVWSLNLLLPLFELPDIGPLPLFDAPSPPWPYVVWTPAAPWIVFGLLGLWLGLSTLVAAWAALGRRPLRLRVLLVCLVPTSALMTAWLALMRASIRGRRLRDESGSSPERPARPRALTGVAGGGLVFLSLVIVVPLGGVYYALAKPMPIPQTVLPEDNAYPLLSQLAEQISRVQVPDTETATKAQLRAFVDQHGQVLDGVRTALLRPCQVPVEYTATEFVNRDPAAKRPLVLALRAEGKLAELEGRPADAARSYLTAVRLGHALGRGGLGSDALLGNAVAGIGVSGLRDVRKTLPPEEQGAVIRALRSLEAQREPAADVVNRDRVWEDQVYGWQCRLRALLDPESVGSRFEEMPYFEQARVRLLICELAIQMYRSEHGSPPERLTDLVPDYLSAVPQDPYGEGPLVYRRTGQDYLLYSVSTDGRDDGGLHAMWYWDPPADLFLDEPAEEEEESDPKVEGPAS
jgi:hypothetical protein